MSGPPNLPTPFASFDMTDQSIADLRQEYRMSELNEADADGDPLMQFRQWFAQAREAQLPEVNAMAVSSVDARGRPSSRILLLKGVEQGGFTFFTNYDSRKGGEFAANPHIALVFLWYVLERQVRVEGHVEKISAAESDEYYAQRPLGSRLGAWASPQSQPTSRAELEARQQQFADQYADDPPRPPHWGGYRVMPDMIEFWQGRPSRLHDRLRYRLQDDVWQMDRLAP